MNCRMRGCCERLRSDGFSDFFATPADLSCQLLVCSRRRRGLATLDSIEMRRLSELCILLLIVAGEGAVSQQSQRRQYSYYRGRQLGTVSRVRPHHYRHQQVMQCYLKGEVLTVLLSARGRFTATQSLTNVWSDLKMYM